MREVVNMIYANFHWILITSYIPVKLWKWQLDQNLMSRLPGPCNVHGWHRGLGKTTVLACSRDARDWCKLLQIIENLSSYKNRCICDFLGLRVVERSYPRPLAGRQFYCLCLRGLCYRDKDASSASRDYGAAYLASTRPTRTGVDTFVQAPSQNQGHRNDRG